WKWDNDRSRSDAGTGCTASISPFGASGVKPSISAASRRGRRARAFTLVELPAVSPPRRIELPAVSRRRSKAFTLVELLVVVGIIALLVTILMPALSRALELTRKVICQTNLHTLGKGWLLYWTDNDSGQPGMVLGERGGIDSLSQFNDQLSGSWRNYTGPGYLYRDRYVTSGDAFVCPTTERYMGGTWFAGGWKGGGAWPPPAETRKSGHTLMTYGIRRMAQYDNSVLADVDYWHTGDPRTDDLMLMKSGVGGIARPSDFSLMADCFRDPEIAIRSHVPSVNVLWLDGHVGDYTDDTEYGEVLYGGNGITTEYNDNWLHDDIWMIIDGYHQPPVGQ
ncbi:hypothetical protein LCGC14_2638260, partial [marine sediment metagenome]